MQDEDLKLASTQEKLVKDSNYDIGGVDERFFRARSEQTLTSLPASSALKASG